MTADRLTLVDFGIAAFLPTAEDAKLPWEDYKQIRRWHEGLMKIDGWATPWPNA